MKFLTLALLIVCGCRTGAVNKEIPCNECRGTGKVFYDKDHPITKMGFKIGEYQCPMCRGSGILVEQ